MRTEIVGGSVENETIVGLTRKIAMVACALKLGRRLSDKLGLMQFLACHGGLGRFTGRPLLFETTVENAGSLHLRHAGPDAILFSEILVGQEYRCLHQLSFQPTTILDIGANIGLGSLYLRSLYPKARITGFEPSPSEFGILSANYADWKECVCHSSAIGDQDGIPVSFAVHPDRTGGQHLVSEGGAGDWDEIRVTMRRVDRLIEEGAVPLPDLVKMDIEGAEVAALTGFGRYLSEVKAFIVETHSPQLHERCLELLQANGHRILFDDSPRTAAARILLSERRI